MLSMELCPLNVIVEYASNEGWIKITTECLLLACDKILVGFAIHNFAYIYQEVNVTIKYQY